MTRWMVYVHDIAKVVDYLGKTLWLLLRGIWQVLRVPSLTYSLPKLIGTHTQRKVWMC